MKFTDLFIRRPVLSIVVSLLVLVLGLRALAQLPVREFPKSQIATVTVTTYYYGANSDVIAGFITTPLETAIAQAQGIDYISSNSTSGQSQISANLRLNYDANRALTEISAKVNSVLNQLPAQAQKPQLEISTGESTDSMYISFSSKVMPSNKVTDYLTRVVRPKLQAVPGVQLAEILGQREFALRAWLDPDKLAARGLTAQDVYTAIGANHYISALGTTKGQMVTMDITAGTDLHSVEEFRKLVIRQSGFSVVRLEDIANVTLGSENVDFDSLKDGTSSVFVGIKVAPDANVLTVNRAVREVFPDIAAQLPEGLEGSIDYDSSEYINNAIAEVEKTLIEALVIVTFVIFLFLGAPRSVLIPAVAIPLSLIGGFLVMLILGYSINLLTLLALVLAIGLVVDDAIIVVENVDRHLKEGKSPLQAALIGARELTGPIIAISVVLIAVYLPIGFQGGLTGSLFSEFAFTLAGAVGVSAVVALTLSPMLCSRLLRAHDENRLVAIIDRNFEWARSRYERLLGSALKTWPVVVTFGFIIFALIFVLAKFAKQELAPEEDQSFMIVYGYSKPGDSLGQTLLYTNQVRKIVEQHPERKLTFQLVGIQGVNSALTGVVLKPWEQREKTAMQLQQEVQQQVSKVAAQAVYASLPPPLPTGSGGTNTPIAFVITTTDPFIKLDEVSQELLSRAQASGKFYFIDTDLRINKPQVTVQVDRDKAATLGLTMQDIGSALGAMLGGGYVNYFSISGRSYKVIPQVEQQERLNPEQLSSYQIRAADGTMVPASTVISLKTEAIPARITHFQQLNSATFSAVSSVSMGEALDYLKTTAQQIAPKGYTVDYAGQSRQYMQESSSFALTFAFAIVIIFLALSAQFGSFRDPLIVMMSVPMAIFGAMVFIFLGVKNASMNIYTEVGLVTLIGLIAKHGILIVQFANDEQRAGKTKLEAIMSAAGIRLRPILMTTAAMVLSVIPLITASGAGAVSRNHMGLVIFTGISIGTLFTLFVVPAMYLMLAVDRSPKKAQQHDTAADGAEPDAILP
ncbi:multidrug efflux pump [Solimonas aquatica]|uniref:Multidrug efflux pump n=1 Tax=Solimonas aquatica TaxID=489703 RepID=A0A1H9GVH7_9GAMM|nr:efflux RND transporter permease subunit [Solimonas aquatica]SEQ54064.1 multidrug efflux pump [Solimonas aquatica]